MLHYAHKVKISCGRPLHRKKKKKRRKNGSSKVGISDTHTKIGCLVDLKIVVASNDTLCLAVLFQYVYMISFLTTENITQQTQGALSMPTGPSSGAQ